MNKYTISYEEIKDYKIKHILASSFGKGSNKVLYISIIDEKISYVVEKGNDKVFVSKDVNLAIDVFNDIS